MSGSRRLGAAIVASMLIAGSVEAQDFSATLERGIALQLAGKFDEALAAYEAALRVADFGDPNWEVATANLAVMYAHFGRLNEAQALLERMLAMQRENLGRDHERVGRTLGILGQIYHQQQLYDQALDTLLRAFTISRRYEPIESPRMLRTIGALALAGQMSGSTIRAERLTEILEQLEARVGPRDSRLAVVLSPLASIAIETGGYTEAERLIERIKHLDAPSDRRGVDWTSTLPAELAQLYERMGRNPEALEQTELVGKLIPVGDDPTGRAERMRCAYWGSKGEILLAMGQVREATELLEAALNGRDRIGVLGTVANVASLGRCYERLGERDRAEAMYERARSDTHARVGNRVHAASRLARLLGQRRKFAEAEQLLFEGIAHCEKYGIQQSAFHAEMRRSLGEVYLLAARWSEAEQEFRTAIGIVDRLEGQTSAPLATDWLGLARALAGRGRFAEAIDAADRSRRYVHEMTIRVLPALPEAQQREFLDNEQRPPLYQALELARQHPAEARVLERSASWLLNTKGLAQQAVAERMLLAREADDSSLMAVVDDWLGVSRQLAAFSASDGSDRQRQIVAELTKREQELSRQLGEARLRQEITSAWIELPQLRDALAETSVFVELSLHVPPEAGAKPVYLAWLVPPTDKGRVTLIDLGPAVEIDAAIAALQGALATVAGRVNTKGLELADAVHPPGAPGAASYDALAERVSDLVVRPLLTTLAGYEHWIISPDAALWLLPWPALPRETSNDGMPRYVVERHRVSFVVSGRDLIDADDAVSGNPPLVLADPDFDERSTAQPSTEQFAERPSFVRGIDLRAGVGVPMHWSRLPGTAIEAATIAPALEEYTHQVPEVLLGGAASEDRLKAAWRPRIAVFSTHGFVLDNSPSNGAGPPRNPLLECGLVFAGANRKQPRADPGRDDGIVTGMDVLSTDLRATELVILSACETGLGQINAGEGVAGLRQAFQLAGARGVMASLWRIPDQETAELMTLFFKRLTVGDDKATALQHAQQAFLERRRKGHATTAHPFYWAAFTLTGDWRTPSVGPMVDRPARRTAVRQVEVIVEQARVMDGTTVVTTLVRSQRVARGRTHGEYIEVFYQPGSKRSAWVHRNAVRELP